MRLNENGEIDGLVENKVIPYSMFPLKSALSIEASKKYSNTLEIKMKFENQTVCHFLRAKDQNEMLIWMNNMIENKLGK